MFTGVVPVDLAVEWLKSSGLRLCALGADAESLVSLGLTVHVVPDEVSWQGRNFKKKIQGCRRRYIYVVASESVF